MYFFIYSVLPHADLVNNEINNPDFGRKKLATKTSINFDEISEKFEYYLDRYANEIELLFFLPLTAFGFFLLNKRQSHLYYTHHFIASIHLSSAWFIQQTVIEIFNLFFPNHTLYVEVLNIILLIYYSTLMKNVYNISFIWSMIKAIVLIVITVIMLFLFTILFILLGSLI